MSIFNHFQDLTLSNDQNLALEKLEIFLNSLTQVFMLKGYAGSGKTTILKGLVEYLSSIEKEFALMAPTGRAAKVIRERTGQEAFTVHKGIYSYEELTEVDEGESFFYYYKIRNNVDVANKIFIIDEASMLSDAKSEGEFFRFGTGHLLSDLISFTRVNTNTAHSKIIFVGDPCQLAPVGDNSSKAFDAAYLAEKYGVNSDQVEMKEVMRQCSESGILKAASKFRKSITSDFYNNFNLRENGLDIFNPSSALFLETWEKASSPKIIITYKNKTCQGLNSQIRRLKFGNVDLPIQKGDIVIIGGNNYRKNVFNGEFAVVNEVSEKPTKRIIKFYGKPASKSSSEKSLAKEVILSWRAIELVFPDAESNNKIVTGQMLDNFLDGDNNLTPEEMQALYVDFKNRHKELKPKSEEFKESIINDEYFNCLKMKYGYSVTCHKAQGGEWDNVFTIWDHDNRENFNCFKDEQLTAGKLNEPFFRWAYTAITRASKKLFALNPPYFNSYYTLSIMEVDVINSLNELTGNNLQTDEIDLDNDLLNELNQFGLLKEPLELQDHFIKVRHSARKRFIEIIGWQKKDYEVRYKFQRENSFATGKTSINGKNQFKNSLLYLSSMSNDKDLFLEIEELWKSLPNVTIRRNTTETILDKVQFDFDLEERFHFTRNLFDDLEILFLATDISVVDVEHLEYKERYSFKRSHEIAVLDFEYNKKGFFGRVVPIQKQSNSTLLLGEIQKALRAFKQGEHAI